VLGDFSEGFVRVKQNNKWGFINKARKVLIPFKYGSAYSFSEGLAKVELNNEKFYISKAGKKVAGASAWSNDHWF